MGLSNYAAKVRAHFRFSIREVEELLTISLVFGFILTFTDWGNSSLDFESGIYHLLAGCVGVLVSIFLHNGAKKLLALYHGYTLEHAMWINGVITSLLFTIVTNGHFKMFMSSSFIVTPLPKHRLGTFRGPQFIHLAYLAMGGYLASAIVAALALLLDAVEPTYILPKIVTFNVLYIVYNVLPLPKLDGIKIFFISRVWYVFALTGVLSFFIIALAGSISFVIPLGLAVIAAIVFYSFYERNF